MTYSRAQDDPPNLWSKIFKFVVGQEPEVAEIEVHRDTISALSDSLHVLCNGPMKEGVERQLTLDDVDPATFYRVCQFAYWGDYQEAKAIATQDDDGETKDTSQTTEIEDLLADFAEERRGSYPPPRYKAKKSSFHYDPTPWEDTAEGEEPKRSAFDKLDFGKSTGLRTFVVQSNSSSAEDFAPVFLSHAKVYVFAVKYDAVKLKNLSLQKLYSSLNGFRLYKDRTKDVVALTRYIFYLDDEGDPRVPEPDLMQDMVIKYIGRERQAFKSCDALYELVQEGGTLASELVKVLI